MSWLAMSGPRCELSCKSNIGETENEHQLLRVMLVPPTTIFL